MKPTHTTLLRRLVPAAAVLVALGLLLVPVAGATRVARLPDPCSAVSAAAVNVAFDASADTAEFGTPGTRRVHGVTAKTCTWTYASAMLVVSVAPKTFRPPAWPPGTTSRKATGLGAGAKLVSNKRAGHAFLGATFTKGAHWGEVWINGAGTTASVLRLSRSVYARL